MGISFLTYGFVFYLCSHAQKHNQGIKHELDVQTNDKTVTKMDINTGSEIFLWLKLSRKKIMVEISD
jgi:hypothetical protein